MKKGKVPFAVSFDRLQTIMDMRFINPLWKIKEIFDSPKRDLDTIRSFASNIVSNRRKEIHSFDHFDLLSLLMQTKKDDGTDFEDRELVDHVMNFIIAGRDTTAQALSWCLYYLNQNPRVLKKLYKEIDETVDKNETPAYDQIKNMKYANAVFHEALRLSPSVPKNSKVCISPDRLPDGIC